MIGAYTERSMADNRTTSTGQPPKEPESVLGSLSATRPERFGRARREVPVATVQPRGPRPAKPKPARAKAAAPKRAKATRATPAAAKKPAAVTAGCPPLERPKSAPPPPRPIGHPSGSELVTTAIQATGELARIGLTVGGQMLKRAYNRLPRP
jgi:hypothetical protein